MEKMVVGVVHGDRIELQECPGLAEGASVEVILRPLPPSSPGDGILRVAGALADDEHWDAIMEEIHRSRRPANASHGGRVIGPRQGR